MVHPEISVVMCTRNRARQLERTLGHLAGLQFAFPWELVLVDNGSTDETASIIDSWKDTAEVPMRPVFEPKPGLSRARNRGIGHARADIIAFTDDDCYPEQDFLEAVYRCFDDSDVAYCGGRVLLFDPTDQPATTQTLNRHVEVTPGSFVRAGLIIGANMAVRRRHLVSVRGFDERLGGGAPFKAAEDTDMINRLSMAGLKGVFDPSITVYHHHGRKTVEDKVRLENGYAFGQGSLMLKHCARKETRGLYMRHWYWRLREFPVGQTARELLGGARFFLTYGPSPRRIWEHPHEGLSSGALGHD